MNPIMIKNKTGATNSASTFNTPTFSIMGLPIYRYVGRPGEWRKILKPEDGKPVTGSNCKRSARKIVKAYDFGRFGVLRLLREDGQVMASANDVRRIAGLPDASVPINFPISKKSVVNRFPGIDLNRDGLYPGIVGTDGGVRIDYLLEFFAEAHGGSLLIDRLTKEVLPDIYEASGCDNLSPSGRTAEQAVESFRQSVIQIFHGQPVAANLNSCGPWLLRRGIRVWIAASAVSILTGCPIGLVTSHARGGEVTEIENADLKIPGGGARTYVAIEVFMNMVRAVGPPETAASLARSINLWVREFLVDPDRLRASGATVFAATLHAVLGGDLPYNLWAKSLVHERREILQFGKVIEFCDSARGLPVLPEDEPIPVTVAREIALASGGTQGKLVARLLLDGGFCDQGSVDEPADDLLLRFRRILPGQRDEVVRGGLRRLRSNSNR
jgi:hypothetical protein